MTKRVNMGPQNSTKPVRKGGVTLLPVIALIGICAAWAGFNYERSGQVEVSRPVNNLAEELQRLIEDCVSDVRDYLDSYLYR